MLRSILASIAWKHRYASIKEAMHVRNVRTDKEPLTLSSYPQLSNAHRGGSKIDLVGEEKAPSAAATRGLKRTPDQHMADVAAHALTVLRRLTLDSRIFYSQVEILSNHLGEEVIPEELLAAAGTWLDFRAAREAMRDIAATLPIPGMDYGEPHHA